MRIDLIFVTDRNDRKMSAPTGGFPDVQRIRTVVKDQLTSLLEKVLCNHVAVKSQKFVCVNMVHTLHRLHLISFIIKFMFIVILMYVPLLLCLYQEILSFVHLRGGRQGQGKVIGLYPIPPTPPPPSGTFSSCSNFYWNGEARKLPTPFLFRRS